jgi:hypothetical protein
VLCVVMVECECLWAAGQWRMPDGLIHGRVKTHLDDRHHCYVHTYCLVGPKYRVCRGIPGIPCSYAPGFSHNSLLGSPNNEPPDALKTTLDKISHHVQHAPRNNIDWSSFAWELELHADG